MDAAGQGKAAPPPQGPHAWGAHLVAEAGAAVASVEAALAGGGSSSTAVAAAINAVAAVTAARTALEAASSGPRGTVGGSSGLCGVPGVPVGQSLGKPTPTPTLAVMAALYPNLPTMGFQADSVLNFVFVVDRFVRVRGAGFE